MDSFASDGTRRSTFATGNGDIGDDGDANGDVDARSFASQGTCPADRSATGHCRLDQRTGKGFST